MCHERETITQVPAKHKPKSQSVLKYRRRKPLPVHGKLSSDMQGLAGSWHIYMTQSYLGGIGSGKPDEICQVDRRIGLITWQVLQRFFLRYILLHRAAVTHR